MKIRICVFGHIVIEDDVDTFNIHTTSEQVSGHENTCLEFFEFLVTRQTKAMQGKDLLVSSCEWQLTDLPEPFHDGFPQQGNSVRLITCIRPYNVGRT